jgi:hypothetical protein
MSKKPRPKFKKLKPRWHVFKRLKPMSKKVVTSPKGLGLVHPCSKKPKPMLKNPKPP